MLYRLYLEKEPVNPGNYKLLLNQLRDLSDKMDTLAIATVFSDLFRDQPVHFRSDHSPDNIREILAPFGVGVEVCLMHERIRDIVSNWHGPYAVAPNEWLDGPYLNTLSAYLNADHDVTNRHQYPLHVTASGVILDTTNRAVLLVRHTAMRKWLFPGGHLDPNEIMLDAAKRELLEETGLDVGGFTTEPFVIDTHTIPANPKKDEPVHWHCDFSYIFTGPVDRTQVRMSAESTGFLWVDTRDMLAEHCQHWKRPHIECVGRILEG